MRRGVRLLVGAAWTAAAMSCAVEEAGIDPPDGAGRRFYYPSGLALDTTGNWLYVTNANADLLYNSGTLQKVDVSGTPRQCRPDPVGPALETCEEEGAETGVIHQQFTIGSFAGDIEIDDAGARLYFATRSRPSGVVRVDLESGALPEDGDQDRVHIVETHVDANDAELPAEPFGVALLRACDPPRLLVTHLLGGTVSMLHDCDDDGLKLADSSPVVAPSLSGSHRAFGLAAMSADCESPSYVTSSTSSEVGMVVPDVSCDPCQEECASRLVTGPTFSLAPPLDNEIRGADIDGSDARGIAFDASGLRAWISVREPPALLRVDTRPESDGSFRNRVDGIAEVCPQPSAVRVRTGDAGRPMVYVVCFATHQIFVVDGDVMQLVDVIETGRGPATLEFDPARPRAFVAHYAENTIGEIDLDPASPTFHVVIRTLGLPEPLLE